MRFFYKKYVVFVFAMTVSYAFLSNLSLPVFDMDGLELERGRADRLPERRPPTRAAAVEERINLVYIKMFKCASETLSSIFRRFGYIRDLAFVLPVKDKMYLGWPYVPTALSHRPSKTGIFNIVVDHVLYNRDYFSQLMPNDSVYVTSICQPFDQFRSTFHYYNVKNVAKVKRSPDPLREYLEHIELYERTYQSAKASRLRYCVPDNYSMTRHPMTFNLGYPVGNPTGSLDLSQDEYAFSVWLQHISDRFDLILIFEFFDESLIMLKRLMKWQHFDILHTALNKGNYPKSESDADLEEMYKQWSPLDYKLYNHFNRTLWQQIRVQGNDFVGEVTHFKHLRNTVEQFCKDPTPRNNPKMFVPKTRWSQEFYIDTYLCYLWSQDLRSQIVSAYDKIASSVKPVVPDKVFC